MNREVLDRWGERGILGLVLGILIFSPLAIGAVRVQEFLVVQLLTADVLLLWLGRIWLNDRPKFLFPPMCWCVLAFSCYAVMRYLNCDVEYVGREELLRVLVYTVLFFAVLNNLHRQESAQIISFTLFGLAMAISFYAIFQFITGSNQVWHFTNAYKGRGTGTYLCPNHLGGFLEMLLPLTLAYALVGRGKPLTKILLTYAGLVMAAGVVVTGSRGSWVACGAGLVFLAMALVAYRSFRWPAILMLVVLIGGGTMAVSKTDFFKKRLDRAFVGGSVDLDTRLVMWDSAVCMWRDHVWFGVGPGHYDLRFRPYRPGTVQRQPERVHNDYLNALTDFGALGGIIIAAALVTLTVGVVKVWKYVQRGEREFSSNQSDKFAFMLGASAGIVAILLHSVVDFNMQIPANAVLAVMLMALLTSQWRFATERFWFSARLGGKLVASVLLLTIAGYLGWQEIRLGKERIWLNRAAKAEDFSLNKAALLERAYAAEPQNYDTAYEIGEIYRLESFEGRSDYSEFADKALAWYSRGITNNPFNSDNYMRIGMVLDFIDRHAEAEEAFMKADELDPNGYFTSAHIGRHYVEVGEYAAARPWLERSLFLFRTNRIAEINLKLATDRLMEAANDPQLRMLRNQMR